MHNGQGETKRMKIRGFINFAEIGGTWNVHHWLRGKMPWM